MKIIIYMSNGQVSFETKGYWFIYESTNNYSWINVDECGIGSDRLIRLFKKNFIGYEEIRNSPNEV